MDRTATPSVGQGLLPWADAPISKPTRRNTRREAASAIASASADLRRRILDYLCRCGRHGATDAEIQAALRLAGDTERPRRRELQREGLVYDSGDVRPGPSGRAMRVWKAVRR